MNRVIDSRELLNVHHKHHNKSKLEKIYEDYSNRIIYVSDRYPLVNLSKEPNMWSKEFHDRTWLFWHHCLVSVGYLIDSYFIDFNKRKLKLAYNIVIDWNNHNNSLDALNEMAWHDHSTALRLLNITKLYITLKNNKQNKMCERLLDIVNSHMEKLADVNFYMPKHNHGLDQDVALLYAALFVKKENQDGEYAQLAVQRFWEQLYNIFAEDGSYLEHSPQYIYLMLERLLNVYKLTKNIIQRNNEELFNSITNIVEFLIYILHPNGNFPTLGDSENVRFKFSSPDWKLISEEQYQVLNSLINKNNNTSIEKPLDKVFKDGDYAFLRNNWENNHSTNQIIFTSAFHSRVHKHHDDLSFILYSKNLPIFIDSGKYSYEYDKEQRKYVTSNLGHNTIRLNKMDSTISRLNIGKSGILSWLLTKNISYISGFNCLFENHVHRRLFIYLKPYDIIILDIVKGLIDSEVELLFNLHPDITVFNEKNNIIGYINDNSEFTVTSLINSNSNFEIFKGNKDPLRGWYSPNYKDFIPSTQLSKKKNGDDIRFATHINLLPDNRAITDFYWDNNIIKFKFKNFRVEIFIEDIFEHIIINDKYFKSRKNFTKNNIFEHITNYNAEKFSNKFNINNFD